MNKDVIIWAESEAEALDFLKLLGDKRNFNITNIYVAKRSGGKRDVGHKYLAGHYFAYDPDKRALAKDPIIAPQSVTALVQWCSQDIILTDTNETPIVVIETTYHILTYNNIAQRIPRIVIGSSLGVPSIIFQKIDPSSEVLASWFTTALLRAGKIYDSPCLAILFSDDEFEDAREMLLKVTNELANSENVSSVFKSIEDSMNKYAEKYDEDLLLNGKRGNGRSWLNVTDNSVLVSVGVRDNCALTDIPGYGCQGSEKDRVAFRKTLKDRALGAKGCVWLSKGTGGMDPYPGLVKLAELLFCYDSDGKRTKKLVVEFAKLPKNFWWFAKNKNEIYYKLVNEFADEVRYAKTYLE